MRAVVRAVVLAVAMLGALAACATHRARLYEPSPAATRLTTNGLRRQLSDLLPVECPHLLGNRPRLTGTAQLALAIDSAGRVVQARLVRSSGRGMMDDIIGALASELQLAPPTPAPDAGTTTPQADGAEPPLPMRTLLVEWTCARTASTVRVMLAS